MVILVLSIFTLCLKIHLDPLILILQPLKFILLLLCLISDHVELSLALLCSFLEQCDLIDSLNNIGLYHLNACLKASIFPDETFHLHFLLSLKHLTAYIRLAHLLYSILGFNPLLFQSLDFHLLLGLNPNQALHVSFAFFQMPFVSHYFFVFLSVQEFHLTACV